MNPHSKNAWHSYVICKFSFCELLKFFYELFSLAFYSIIELHDTCDEIPTLNLGQKHYILWQVMGSSTPMLMSATF